MTRAYITGGTGFVGSNVTKVFGGAHGADVCAPDHSTVDLTDRPQVLASVAAFAPDVIVHCAIWNDIAGLYADRPRGWENYVSATRHLVEAANAVAAKIILVSTDWVFDGTKHGSDESTPPNPINLYGVLKLASEMVVTERARDGAVARLAGVNGVHRARPARAANSRARRSSPRTQDAGFGYFAGSIVDALSAGRTFEVWESDDINMIATPSLASDCAEMMWRIVEVDGRGIFHCCGAESMTRRQLARLTAEVFELDAGLLRFGPPPQRCPMPVPYDTSLSAAATAVALEVELSPVRDQLATFRRQVQLQLQLQEGRPI